MNDRLPPAAAAPEAAIRRPYGRHANRLPHRRPGLPVPHVVRTYLPPVWLALARRSFWSLSETLPRTLQKRLHDLAGIIRSDMVSIEEAYPTWISQHDRLDAAANRRILSRIADFRSPPLISVIMPVFNPDPAHLSAAIRSVEQQLYPHWQLCIADDASTNPAVTGVLRDAAARDPRIKIAWRQRNGHISAASNSALSIAQGSFVALLDHDDVLSLRALYEVAARIVERPDIDIIYSEEDHIDAAGRRSHPYFKPGWNPDLLMGHNLISHLGVYRRALVERVGGFRAGFEGSQDYDLALRVVAETHADRIVHIPHVLYHWRQDQNDRTFSQASHDRCVSNARRAIQEFVSNRDEGAIAAPAPAIPTWTRVIYPVPDAAPLVSVIVRADGDADSMTHCLDALADSTDYAGIEVLVTGQDDGGGGLTGDVKARLRSGNWRFVNQPRYVETVNAAAGSASGSLILLLDADVEAAGAGWMRELVSHAIRREVGAVGAKLLDPDGMICHAGLTVAAELIAQHQFPGRQRFDPGYFGHLQLVRNVTAVSAACLMLRRETFLRVGGLDENPAMAPFSHVDLCLKLLDQGYLNVWTPFAELTCGGLADTSAAERSRSRRAASIIRRRWGHRLSADRHWNPNLSLDRPGLSLVATSRDAGRYADLAG